MLLEAVVAGLQRELDRRGRAPGRRRRRLRPHELAGRTRLPARPPPRGTSCRPELAHRRRTSSRAFRRATEEHRRSRGVGLPGRVLARASRLDPRRRRAIRASRDRSVWVCAARSRSRSTRDGEVNAVLEFFTRRRRAGPRPARGDGPDRPPARPRASSGSARRSRSRTRPRTTPSPAWRTGSSSATASSSRWRAPSATARSRRCCSSISTGSRTSTTRSGTAPATSSCGPSRSG